MHASLSDKLNEYKILLERLGYKEKIYIDTL